MLTRQLGLKSAKQAFGTRAPDRASPAIRPAPANREAQQSSPVFKSLVCETQTAALLSATVTSIINGLGKLPDGMAIAELKRHQPNDQSQVPSLRGWLTDADVDPSVTLAITYFFQDLGGACRQLRQLFTDAARMGEGRAVVLHRAELGRTWRGVCAQAIFAITEIDNEVGRFVNELYSQSLPTLVGLLEEARDGNRPCLDPSGKPFVPALAQRRRSPRRMMLQECMLQVRRRTIRAMVRDVATGGLGLSKVGSDIGRNDIVVIEMFNGRRLTGSVMWAKDGLAGVKFATPLGLNDPLIAA